MTCCIYQYVHRRTVVRTIIICDTYVYVQWSRRVNVISNFFHNFVCLFLCSMYFLLNISPLHLSGSFPLSLLYFFLRLRGGIVVMDVFWRRLCVSMI